MNETMRFFIKRLLIFSAFLACIGSILFFLLPPGYISKAFPALVLFFLLVTICLIWYLNRASEKSFIKFVTAFMLTTGLKLLLLILVVVGYIFLNPDDKVSFVIIFFILYLLYSGFEVYSVLYLSRHQKKE